MKKPSKVTQNKIILKRKMDEIEKYNERFLKLVGELQVLMVGLPDKQAGKINSALHDFDKEVRAIIKTSDQARREGIKSVPHIECEDDACKYYEEGICILQDIGLDQGHHCMEYEDIEINEAAK